MGDYDEKCTKKKFNSDHDLSLDKLLRLTIVDRSVFLENKKYYWQVFLYECLYEL